MGKPRQQENNVIQLSSPINILPKNPKQDRLINAMKGKQLVFATGSAGTGKTFCAVSLACQLYKQSRRIDNIVLARPNISTGPSLGAFPGEVEDKLAKWLAEPISIVKDVLGKGDYEYMINKEKLILEPIETCRGRSYRNSFIVVDEAQNLTTSQIKMMATRIGEDSTLVFCGDNSQADHIQGNHMGQALTQFADAMVEGGVDCAHIRFKPEDIVRSGIVRDIVTVCETVGL